MLFVATEALPRGLADCIHGGRAFGWQIRMKRYAKESRLLGGLDGSRKGRTRRSEPVGRSSFRSLI